MSNDINLTGQELYERKKIRTALFGMFLAIIGGLTSVMGGLFNNVINGITFANGGFPEDLLGIMAVMIGVTGFADIFAFVAFTIYNIATGRSIKEQLRTISVKGSWLMAISALVAGPLATGLAISAYPLCGMTVAVSCVAATPLILAIASKFMFKETLGPRVYIGIVILVVGTVVTAWSPLENMPLFYVGVLFGLLAALGFASEAILSTFAADFIDPNIGCGFFRTLIAGIGELIFAYTLSVFSGNTSLLPTLFHTLITPQGFILWILIGTIGTALSYGSIYKAFTKTGPARTQAMVFTSPFWSILVGLIGVQIFAPYYAYEATTQVMIGAVVVVIGAVIISSNPKELVNLRDTN